MAIPDPNYIGSMSSDEIWYAGETNICLTDVVDEKAEIGHTHTGYAASTHSHSEYALATDVDALETKVGDSTVAAQISAAIATKADLNHTHTEYAPIEHTHSGYASTSHSHSEYANVSHTHTGYASSAHVHSYNDLEDKPTIPTTLPANGGNADTVDGKHANEFAAVTDLATLQTLVGDTAVSVQINTAMAGKVDIVEGKGLSTNDFTTAEKTKLAGIAAGANKYTLPTATSSVLGGVKTGSNITNSSGTISLTKTNVTSALGYTPFNSSSIIPKSKGGTGADFSDIPANAIIRNSGSGGSDLYYTATGNGACYATSTNGYPTFGTLPVAQGGTGETTAWTNGTVTSLNNTTITSCQFAVFPYLNKAFIRMNVLLGSALAADGARYIAMPSTVATAHTALSCYNHSGYDIHCGMSSDSGIYVINCGTASMSTSVRLYIAGWFSI